METHNPLVFSKHDFAASKATDYDVVGDEIENNSAILRPWEKQKEEQETLKKQRREAYEPKKGVKKPKLIKSKPNSPVASTTKDGIVICPTSEEEYCDPPTEEWIQCCKCQEWWHEESSNYV
ncbi:uncharacterized protein TNCV_5099611 [Trichonephila clavipes]|uniref:Uncharacterized protein n=1 Tax=Trichonephila clavipes TaxID=2585209 RepID=A0A8X6S043_TRICX|nr:uncharacterized protein TNCV_5099611 [Trichonephila clavipes]